MSSIFSWIPGQDSEEGRDTEVLVKRSRHGNLEFISTLHKTETKIRRWYLLHPFMQCFHGRYLSWIFQLIDLDVHLNVKEKASIKLQVLAKIIICLVLGIKMWNPEQAAEVVILFWSKVAICDSTVNSDYVLLLEIIKGMELGIHLMYWGRVSLLDEYLRGFLIIELFSEMRNWPRL